MPRSLQDRLRSHLVRSQAGEGGAGWLRDPVTWRAAGGAAAGARGWGSPKAHLVAMSQLHPLEHRLLHADVLGPPGFGLEILS